MTRRHTKSIVFLAAALVLLANAPVGPAQTAQKNSGKTVVIEVLDGFVSPSILVIQPKTTVIWENDLNKFMNLNFSKGGLVKRSCSDAAGFRPDVGDGPTSNMPPGGSARLCFTNPGIYYFIVTPQGALTLGTQPALGTIIVQTE